MDIEKLHETSTRSLAGTMNFSEVIKTLDKMGVESYRVDLLEKRKSFVFVTGETYSEQLEVGSNAVSADFDDGGVRHAVLQSQAGQLLYLDFLNIIMECGVISYVVYLKGRKTVYYGRHGDCCYENFLN